MIFQALTGEWQLLPDSTNHGREEKWFEAIRSNAKPVPVPGVIQQVFPRYHGVAWYWLPFVPRIRVEPHEQVRIYFSAVDYLAEVWLNGQYLGQHEGGETPFDFDVADALRPGSENLLAIRVLNPKRDKRIDGYLLRETPALSRAVQSNKDFSPGLAFNTGGVLGPVNLVVVPKVRIVNVFVRPQVKTGQIPVTVTVRNETDAEVSGMLTAAVEPRDENFLITEHKEKVKFPLGDSVHERILSVEHPRLWGLEDPYLYRVKISLFADVYAHEYSVRCGFRDFRVVDGYFHLNGKRVFLKSTHTINHVPIGLVVSPDTDFLRRDLLYAKAGGFNMIRSIGGMLYPEQIELCDELGLMVYQETHASWLLQDSPHMKERFDRSFREMILRDRNHPCITIWGMLNETPDNSVFRHAVETLQLVRDLDETRLVLLSSGRWDCQSGIGSVSNPGSRQWEYQWGPEEPGAPASDKNLGFAGFFYGVGDVHYYPGAPMLPKDVAFFRKLGQDAKPIFLSEFGVGSLFNAVDELRRFEQTGAKKDLVDYSLIQDMLNRLHADWKKFRMEGVYPLFEDFFRDSYRIQTRQRAMTFNIIRSNPKLCGYNVTGMLDHCITGEGLWTFWRELKPLMMETLRDGWAPLRWCLFVNSLHGYVGRKIEIEAVLANEDVLPPGKYPVRFCILGPNGLVWERKTKVVIPNLDKRTSLGSLTVSVLKKKVRLDGPAGEYTFAASLGKGGAPMGDRLLFKLSESPGAARGKQSVTLWGIDESIAAWLKTKGIRCQHLGRGWLSSTTRKPREVIFVGLPSKEESTREAWLSLVRSAIAGATVVFLSPKAFVKGKNYIKETTFWLPLKKKGICKNFHDWLYHKECVAKQHPIFKGLPIGILDPDYYGEVIGHQMFQGQDVPEEVVCAAFAVGYNCPGGYDSGVIVGVYNLGAGRIILNTLNILDHIDRHPAADRLLLNLIEFAHMDTKEPVRRKVRHLKEPIENLYPVYIYSEYKTHWEITQTDEKVAAIGDAPLPEGMSLTWKRMDGFPMPLPHFVSFSYVYGYQDGLGYARGEIVSPQDLDLTLLLGTDGPCKIWFDNKVVAQIDTTNNSAIENSYNFPLKLTKGRHTITVTIDRRGGNAEGFFLRFKRRERTFSPEEQRTRQAVVPMVNLE